MEIALPKDPMKLDYEDMIVALVQCFGNFVEVDMTLREGNQSEIAQLDLIATPVQDPFTQSTLVEAKSGDTGFSDIFKLYGQRLYLGLPRACIVRRNSPSEPDAPAFQVIASATEVYTSTVNFHEGVLRVDGLPKSERSVSSSEELARVFRGAAYGRLAQRICLTKCLAYIKSSQASLPGVTVARDYRGAIHQAFLERTPLARAKALYEAYAAHPRITLAVATHQWGERAMDSIKNAWDRCEHHQLQCCMLMEHSARLGIIKNALLYVVSQTLPDAKAPTFAEQVFFSTLPQSFRNALSKLQKDEHRDKVPYLLQLFIEVFGGFYALDDRDRRLIAQFADVPVGDVDRILNYYNEFFPIKNGWFFDYGTIRRLKFVPCVLRGTGAFVRQFCFGQERAGVFRAEDEVLGTWFGELHKLLSSQFATTPLLPSEKKR